MIQARTGQRGVSLIEALVAMAVMAFGLLGLLGLQSSLRSNSDISKQRSEAVRIAQQTTETARTFGVIDATPGSFAYDQIADLAVTPVNPANANTTFQLSQSVTTFPTVASAAFVAPYKSINVLVSWQDRSNTTQSVSLNTIVSGTAPEILAALSTPGVGSGLQQPNSRHVAIPVNAVDQGDGTSRFAPPGAPAGLTWVFSNATGIITQLCQGLVCVNFNGFVLSGYVRFSFGAAPDSENPSSLSLPIGISVTLTAPVAVPAPSCYTDNTLDPTYVAYFCAMPQGGALVPYWSGSSAVTGLPLSASIADPTAGLYRVCRYTTQTQANVPPATNQGHPQAYTQVAVSLLNQNFLVIQGGDGNVPYACPADNPATPNINGNTWPNQPSS